MSRRGDIASSCRLLLVVMAAGVSASPAGMMAKEASTFYPRDLVAAARASCNASDWAAAVRKQVVDAARPWKDMSDQQAWDLVFGPTVKRSWMVFSSGFCPACRQSVPMYNWEIRALDRPWKVRCPHCRELFPKNDFWTFYRSGLDERAVFDPRRADRRLLVNNDHPDPADPLHLFGVDDGNGYVEGDKVWRFIGAYLIYGQWKQAIVGGVHKLGAAYLLTGDRAYAHKAAILLDRVADLYPDFDFKTQAFIYDVPSYAAGYVSVWHDACEEVRELALAYDQIREGLSGDDELVTFLGGLAGRYKSANVKASVADVRRNIEDRILRDTLNHRPKIQSNQPRTEVAEVIIRTVLEWPDNKVEVNRLVDEIVKAGTAVDGVTGEKGLSGYATIGPRSLAELLGRFDRVDPAFLADLVRRQPQLQQTYRFHAETLCLDQYYPRIGDSGAFARRDDSYRGIDFVRPASLDPSGFTFLWRLYELSQDPVFVQALYRGNGGTIDGLPHDLFAIDPKGIQKGVEEVIAREGPSFRLAGVNKRQWHLAILRSGQGDDRRAAWLDYDSDGRHSHRDGLNVGLFAKGLDLMPDLGYPPVQYGGWDSPRARWYTATAAHNTVLVDGKSQRAATGASTLWADGRQFHAVRAAGEKLYAIQRYERTVAVVDVSDRDCYLVDVFRVAGGKEHIRFMHSQYAKLTTSGLSLSPAAGLGDNTQMRGFRMDPGPRPGWSADFEIEDRNRYLPNGMEVHLRYTDLTTAASGGVAEGWVVAGLFNSNDEAWIPRVLTRRVADQAPLVSTFVGVIEPYGKSRVVAGVRRMALARAGGGSCSDSAVAIEIRLTDGQSDLLVLADPCAPGGREDASGAGTGVIEQADWRIGLQGELCMIRRDGSGAVSSVAICNARGVTIGDLSVKLGRPVDALELAVTPTQAAVLAGPTDAVEDVRLAGKSILRRQGLDTSVTPGT
ncbi:MAG TPA: heparinase II/III family protein [Phycisphaerae bacterium]|nr:heparinase II/III family protein [Phycisphaerae bacterium]HRY69502.1 heparinase II/III family protein [Phycisphaerae bacterium]HSA28194.1 heparinase II/III family protein [Phycisphaerae bacterium]